MLYIGLFKRIIPFVLTFTAGLFIASFFVSIVPNFSNWRESRRANHCREHNKMRLTIADLERENKELKRRVAESETFLNAVPPVELKEHRPPAPPKRPKHPRFESLQ